MVDDLGLYTALSSPTPYPSLRACVKALVAEHGSKVVQDALEDVLKDLESKGDEANAGVVMNVLDCLVGWCGEEDRIE